MDASSDKRSSALGYASNLIAVVVASLLGAAYVLGVRSPGSIQYTMQNSSAYAALTFLCAAACLVGLTIGIEGYRRPNTYKVPAIIGALLHSTLLLTMAFGQTIVNKFSVVACY